MDHFRLLDGEYLSDTVGNPDNRNSPATSKTRAWKTACSGSLERQQDPLTKILVLGWNLITTGPAAPSRSPALLSYLLPLTLGGKGKQPHLPLASSLSPPPPHDATLICSSSKEPLLSCWRWWRGNLPATAAMYVSITHSYLEPEVAPKGGKRTELPVGLWRCGRAKSEPGG